MNESNMEALVFPMIIAMKKTIDNMSGLVEEISQIQKRLHLQNNLNGLLGHLNSMNVRNPGSINPGTVIPMSMQLLGNLKSSIQTISNTSQRQILLDQLGFLTSQFLNTASILNKINQPSPVSHRANWGQRRPLSSRPQSSSCTRRPDRIRQKPM